MKKQLQGIVVSDKMAKTVVVKVDRMVIHPKYRKRYQVTTRYKADKASLECNVGDKVVIQESRPISRDKKWILLSVQKNQQAEVE